MQTNLKRIGNSFEVILNKKLLKEAGISDDTDITIEAKLNSIIIRQLINAALKPWFKYLAKTNKGCDKKKTKNQRKRWGNKISEAEENEWTW